MKSRASFADFLHDISIFKRLYVTYLAKHKKLVFLSVFLMITAAIGSAATVYLMKPVVNKIFAKDTLTSLYITCGGLFIAYFVKAISTYFQSISVFRLQEKVIVNLRSDLFQKMLYIPMPMMHHISRGKFMSHFSGDIIHIANSLFDAFVVSIRELCLVLLIIVSIFYNDLKLACVAFFAFPFFIFPIVKLSSKLKAKYMHIHSANDNLLNKLNDIVSCIKTIKAYNAERIETEVFAKLMNDMSDLSVNTQRRVAIASPMMDFVGGISVILVLLYGGSKVINGTGDVGSLVSFIASIFMLYRPIKSLSGIRAKLRTASISLLRIFSFLDDIANEDLDSGLKINMTEPLIKYNKVMFNYKTDQENSENILKNISFEIKPGSKVAFVGHSGCGKSTIINLLLRFYDVSSGSIEINNTNINDIQLSHLRSNIAYVAQDNFLFDDTIKHNITYSLTDKTINDTELQNAISFAQIDFLKDMQNGIDENIGYNGMRLSGGQRQRVAIARAALKNSNIIIFDEGTSALDVITEKAIKDAIFENMKNKTVILIAHRLSTIMDCDMIHVVNEGEIVESGSHNELLAKNGLYARLWSTSFSVN